MKFTFDGKLYTIDFQRKRRPFIQTDGDGIETMKESTHPHTTAIVFESDPATPHLRRPFRVATVGCHHTDKFSKEKGRARALRLITITLPKAMKPVLWKAYHGRTNNVPKDNATAPAGTGDGTTSASVGSPSEA